MGSPCTSANGISTCSGEFDACSPASASALSLSTTTRRSGLVALGVMSVHSQVHGVAHVVERGAGGDARFFGAFRNDVAHELGILLEFLRALADAADLLDHLVDERLLALEAADAGRAATVRGPGAGFLARVDLVQIEYRAFVRIARIRAANPRGVGGHLLEL